MYKVTERKDGSISVEPLSMMDLLDVRLSVMCRGARETPNAREKRMSFRRLKKRYYHNKLSFSPETFSGSILLRGRSVKRRRSTFIPGDFSLAGAGLMLPRRPGNYITALI